MHFQKKQIHADFVQICKYMRSDCRQYLSELQGIQADDLIRDASFGLTVQEGVYSFLIDTLFNEEIHAKAYYGGLLRINFYLNKSLNTINPYSIVGIKLGDALLIKNDKEVSFCPPAKLRIFGLNVLVDPRILLDVYKLDLDNLDFSFRNSIISRKNVPMATKMELPARLSGAVETLERCVSRGVLQDRLLRIKSDEIICEIVYILNNFNAHKRNKKIAMTRNQVINNKIHAVAHYYDQHMIHSANIEDICRSFGLNKNILTDGFKDIYGMTPATYARKISLEWAREQLSSGMYRVQEVAALTGYKSASAFSRAYTAFFGVAPARDGNEVDRHSRSE